VPPTGGLRKRQATRRPPVRCEILFVTLTTQCSDDALRRYRDIPPYLAPASHSGRGITFSKLQLSEEPNVMVPEDSSQEVPVSSCPTLAASVAGSSTAAKNILMNYTGIKVPTLVVMKSSVFWDITPCSPLKVNRHFRGTYCLHHQGQISLPATCFTLVSTLAYLTLKIEICSSKTLVDFEQTM
jgi:hypothetical protein